MKKFLTFTVFMLATLAWAAAQQPGAGQAGSQGSMPGTAQSQRSMPGSPDQNAPPSGMQAGGQDQAQSAPLTEGCLGGNAPNFTVTDTAGTTYKLNIPAGADTSKLAPHVGESVLVQGNVRDTGKGTGAIDVRGIGPGRSKCSASGAAPMQTPPKQ